MTTDFAELLAGTMRLAVPLACVALAATFFLRVGIVNVALDGQIMIAAILYVVGCRAGAPALGILLAALGASALGFLLVACRLTWRMSDLLTSLALLYCAIAVSQWIAQLGFDSPGYAFLGEKRLGNSQAFMIAVGALGAFAVSLKWSRWLRISMVAARSPELATLDGVTSRWLVYLNWCCASILLAVTGIVAVEQGGSFTKGIAADRGFIALAIVTAFARRPLRVLLVVPLFAAAQKLVSYFPGASEIVESMPYLIAIAILACVGWLRGNRWPCGYGDPFYALTHHAPPR